MGSLTVGSYGEAGQISKYQKKHRIIAKSAIENLKKTQRKEFKEGLTEAILISRGEIEGTPLSDIWDE